MDVIDDWEYCAVGDDFEIGDQLPNCREYWQRMSENNAMKITSAMHTPPGTMMLDFPIFVMRNGRSFKYHIDPSCVGQAIQKWRPVNPAQDAIIARPRSPRHFVYDIMFTPDFTDYFTIKVAYALSGGTAALIHYPKDQVLYAGYVYLDLRDRLMDDNIITAITRITVSKRDGPVVKGRQVLYRPIPLRKNKKSYVPVKRIRKKVDPRQPSLRKCFALCK